LYSIQPEGGSQDIDFSSNPEIFAYVPQLKYVGHPFPYICCDIDDLDQDLIGWSDATRSYDYYNLMFEIPHRSLKRTVRIEGNTRDLPTIADSDQYEVSRKLSREQQASREPQPPEEGGVEVERDSSSPTGERKSPLYSIIKHYPTKWQRKLAEQYRNQIP
jgi:hypothetical protein